MKDCWLPFQVWIIYLADPWRLNHFLLQFHPFRALLTSLIMKRLRMYLQNRDNISTFEHYIEACRFLLWSYVLRICSVQTTVMLLQWLMPSWAERPTSEQVAEEGHQDYNHTGTRRLQMEVGSRKGEQAALETRGGRLGWREESGRTVGSQQYWRMDGGGKQPAFSGVTGRGWGAIHGGRSHRERCLENYRSPEWHRWGGGEPYCRALFQDINLLPVRTKRQGWGVLLEQQSVIIRNSFHIPKPLSYEWEGYAARRPRR